ncbi:MAG: hypothetical protein ACRDF4_10330 [Rhabdochlamydiaceae bacterium]
MHSTEELSLVLGPPDEEVCKIEFFVMQMCDELFLKLVIELGLDSGGSFIPVGQ